MRLYSQTNCTTGLVDNLYSTEQQNAEALYQHEMETYANGNRLFRIYSVCLCFDDLNHIFMIDCSLKMIIE